jgi:hypothetical protein
MDNFIGNLNLAATDESPKLLLPSPNGGLAWTGSDSVEGGAVALFDMEFVNGEFTEDEKKKIMANERLVEIALTVPKRVKRCAFILIFWAFIPSSREIEHSLSFNFQDSGK